MVHLSMSRVIYIDGSCHTYEGHVTHMNALCDKISMRHGTAAQHRGGGGAGTQCVAVCCEVLQCFTVRCSVVLVVQRLIFTQNHGAGVSKSCHMY